MLALKVGEGNEQQTYICVHWRTFPPAGAGEDADHLRSVSTIDVAQYDRLRTWQRICGQRAMTEGVCLQCAHRRLVVWKMVGPYLRAPNGVETPVVDAASGEAAPRNRHMVGIFRRPGTKGSLQPAAWAEHSDGND